MSAIQIRVGASVDRSVATVFSQIAEAAKRANKMIAEEAKKAAKTEEGAWKEAATAVTKIEQGKAKSAIDASKSQAKAAKEAAKEEERAAKDKVRAMMKIDREMTQFAAKESRERARAEERAANDAARAWVKTEEKKKKAAQESSRQTASAVGQLGLRALQGSGRFTTQVLSDMASGAGVRLDMASHFANVSNMEDASVQLSNAGYMPGQAGSNGMRQDPRELAQEALKIGNNTGTGANEVMTAMQTFVGKTGDLESARASMQELAKLSKATGSNLNDMSDAAADVSNQLGDIPDKGARIQDVMRAIAGQGKLGAVEIKDLARQMGKVASSASMMEGDAGENIKTLGAIAQESRAHGSASASQAATNVTSLMATFSKGARIGEFKALGIETSGAGGKMRNVEDIIVESLQKTQRKSGTDSNVALGKLFADVRARGGVRGFESLYRSTYAGTKGTEEEKLANATRAVREEFHRLKQVAISQQELNESFAASMDTAKSKAEVFNNELQEIATDAQEKIAPALLALAPVVISATKAVADFAAEFLGVKKPPGEGLDKETGKAHAAVRTVQGIIENPREATEDDYKKAAILLQKRKKELVKARSSASGDIADAKQGGHAVSDIVTDWGGEALNNVQKGGWNAALGLLEAVPLVGLGKAAVKTAMGSTETQKARAGNIVEGEKAVGNASAEEREVDEQLEALRQTHDMFKGMSNGNALNVRIVEDKSRKGGPGAEAGAGTNKGLEDHE